MRLIDADALKKEIGECWAFENTLYDVCRVINNAPTINIPAWIPCSERLPSNFSEDETVLATTDVDGDRVILMFTVDVKAFYLKGYISAWMPLPQPYREEE